MEIAKKFTYQDLIYELQLKSGYSYFKTRTILKELSKLLQSKIYKGVPIECENICKIDYSVSKYTNLNDYYFGVTEQAKELSIKLNINELTLRNFITNYYEIILAKIEQGFQVNIKSVCYITPKKTDTGDIFIDTRMSPQLQKPEILELVVLNKQGLILSKIFDKNIRLNMFLNEYIKLPNRIVTEQTSKVDYINLKNKN